MFSQLFALVLSAVPIQGRVVCQISPPRADLEACRDAGECSGSGVTAWARTRKEAIKIGIKLCEDEFYSDSCSVDYCERWK